ncbi:PREDICTED: dermokine-like [Galeopterus variegatus]|uniref:Dermokine-like n=1 Tax=Galeopterus variegatus TaxID=482537 RepID=A0ABM0RU03_GALVR|nr:PREDICTED: dermokine-like [Galeopterus variegatus]
MKLQGSLACLLLALWLGSGEAGPLLSGGESSGTAVGEAIGHGMGDAISHGVRQAIGQGVGEGASSGAREAVGPGVADTLGHRLGEAAHALGNTGSEAGRQAEDIIRHGIDAAHSSWQGMPGSNGAWPLSGGHGISGSQGSLGGHSQGNPGGPGTPWGHGHPGSSEGSFGANSQGGSWGQGGNGGSFNSGTNAQGTVAQPGYGSVRVGGQNAECTNPPPSGSGGSSGNSGGSNTGSSSGSSGGSGGGNKPGCENPGNEVRMSGGSGGQGFRGVQGGPSGASDIREISKEGNRLLGGSYGNHQGQGPSGDKGRGDIVSGVNTMNSETSPGPFNFDTFWKKFKSKLGFINWDAIDKNQVLSPSTRALLYFRRLWEDFKQNTPFFNWKAIMEGADASSLQKRAGGADQNYNYNHQAYPTAYGKQYSAKTPAKGRVTLSSSASRVQPGLLQWAKFW